jgi:peptidoglycan/xylan/chitin deacetylase (PgdA/CDA1 family)
MFAVLPLDSAIRRLRNGTLPECALAITFDDGYADNRHVAMPILQSLGLPATVFVATGFLDGGCMWNDIVIESFRRTREQMTDLRDLVPQAGPAAFDLATVLQRRAALEAVIAAVKYLDTDHRLKLVRQIAERLQVSVPTDLMMTSGEVAHLRRAGLQVGAHTVSHPILAKLSPAEMRREMKDSKEVLERLLGERISLFAYPNGKPGEDYDERSVALARELGFDAAVTTVRGAASPCTDPYQVPRFTPWDRTPWRFGLRMLGNLWTSGGRAAA